MNGTTPRTAPAGRRFHMLGSSAVRMSGTADNPVQEAAKPGELMPGETPAKIDPIEGENTDDAAPKKPTVTPTDPASPPADAPMAEPAKPDATAIFARLNGRSAAPARPPVAKPSSSLRGAADSAAVYARMNAPPRRK